MSPHLLSRRSLSHRLLSHRSLFLLLAAVVVATALLAPGVRAATTAGPNPSPVPRFTHIVEVFLENEEAGKTWEAGGAANLQAIRASGLYVPNFYGVGHASLSNYEAAFAGVAPSATGKSDCLGQPYGTCIFPAWVPTIADRFDGAGLPWRAYAEGMAGAANGVACLHAPDRNAPDPYQGPLTNGYASRHNPAVWFERVISKDGSNAYCRAHDVDLEELWKDADAGRLPAFSFVTPDTCHDGHDTSSTGGCALDPEGPGAPSGTAAMDAWLPGFVHRLTSSPSWDDHSLLIITFDESEAADSTGCVPCKDGSTGGRIGAVLLSHLVVAGSTTEWQGDHFSILRTLETAWGLEPIGHDGDPGVTPLTGVWVNQ